MASSEDQVLWEGYVEAFGTVGLTVRLRWRPALRRELGARLDAQYLDSSGVWLDAGETVTELACRRMLELVLVDQTSFTEWATQVQGQLCLQAVPPLREVRGFTGG